MPTNRTRLSARVIDKAERRKSTYRIWDTEVPQLFVLVLRTGIKSFNVQWNRSNSVSLGKWPAITVDSARAKARKELVEVDKLGAPTKHISKYNPASGEMLLGEFMSEHYAPWALAQRKGGAATVGNMAAQFEARLYKKKLKDIALLEIERYRNERLADDKKPATVNRDIGRLQGVLSKAVEWGFLPVHPLARLRKLKGADDSRVRYLQDDEDQRLWAALARREQRLREQRASGNEWLRARNQPEREVWPADGYADHLEPMIVLALNTGMRRGEITSLRWDDIDFASRHVRVRVGNAKTSKARRIALNDSVVSALLRWQAKHDGSSLLFNVTTIYSSWESIMDDADIDDFHFHDLRHTFASRLVMKGVDLNTVRELMGHSDIRMTLRYAHLAPSHTSNAVRMLDSWIPA